MLRSTPRQAIAIFSCSCPAGAALECVGGQLRMVLRRGNLAALLFVLVHLSVFIFAWCWCDGGVTCDEVVLVFAWLSGLPFPHIFDARRWTQIAHRNRVSITITTRFRSKFSRRPVLFVHLALNRRRGWPTFFSVTIHHLKETEPQSLPSKLEPSG